MTSPTLTRYLTRQRAAYDVLVHDPTESASRTAQACHVSGDRLAKAVVLHDGSGYVVAVLPASHHLRLKEIAASAPIRMASEDEIARLFPDCARGAVPPLGMAYGLKTIVDDSIATMSEVYFEGGDHATLVHMSGGAFRQLLGDAAHARISTHD
jgi:Ala-tRNA(Pro) deacylase